MEEQSQQRRTGATFDDVKNADLAADAVRRAGFRVDRPTDFSVDVDAGRHAGEVEAMLAAYGAREFSGASAQHSASASGSAAQAGRVRTEQGARIELVEEDLRARTRSVEIGELTIRKNVVEETRTIEVPLRREEWIIEQHPVQRHPMDTSDAPTPVNDPLIQQLIDRLRNMQPGESLRIPIIQEELVVYKRPVVVEEITVGKRQVTEKQKISETVRREEVRIERHGDITVHES